MGIRALILAAAAWLALMLAGLGAATATATTATATGSAAGPGAASPGGGAAVQGPLGPPTVVVASDATVVGVADPAALVALYTVATDGSPGALLGSVSADATGVWQLSAVVSPGQLVAATQESAGGPVSALSASLPAVKASAAGPPTATIVGPSGPTRADGDIATPTPGFTLAPSDPAAVTLCRLDAGAYAVCPGAYTASALGDGPHTLYVRGVDAQGLGPEVSQSFQVDLAPVATITSGPARFGRRSSPSFHFRVPAGTAATACAVDTAADRRCTTSFAPGYLLDGRHVFHLRTTDASGQSTVLDTVFTIDTLKPGITVSSSRITVGASGSATFTVGCPASEPGGCSGTLALATVPATRKDRPRRILSVGWAAGGDVDQRIVVPVPVWALAAALKPNGILTKLTVTARDNAGNTTVISRGGRLRASASAVWRDHPARALRVRPAWLGAPLYSLKY